MGGMEIMLKSMGFDPAALKQTAEEFMKQFREVSETVRRVESNQKLILEILENGSRRQGEGRGRIEPAAEQEKGKVSGNVGNGAG